MKRPSALLIAIATIVLAMAAACSTGQQTSSGGKVQIVAAESFWGSIAEQLGGDRVTVTEIINNPDADPHDYEPTPADAPRSRDGAIRDRERSRLRHLGE